MRFLLILLVALSLTLIWQSSVVAGVSSTESRITAAEADKPKEAVEDEEPDCD